MTAPVLDPVRSAPARTRRPVPPPVRGPGRGPAAPPLPARPDLRVLRPEETATDADRARLVRQLALAATALVALCIFGIVVCHVMLTQNQFRLDKMQEESLERQAEYDRLRLQVAELESPDRIVAVAQAEGMVTPPKVTYLTPTVEEPGAGTTAKPSSDRAGAPEASWSTVKPHLAVG